jgi:glycosyltransferase involved in cell wall biosynthesis
MKICALLATFNEERTVDRCIGHLISQGLDVYLIDNGSTDRTCELARRHLGHGLVGIETLERRDVFSLRSQLERKEQLARSLDADWFLHVDADEMPVPDPRFKTLADGVAAAHAEGYNVINFDEVVFLPTAESPDHDHARYAETMTRYYYFAPWPNRLQRLWRRRSGAVDLRARMGHAVGIRDKRIYPINFILKHYICLGHAHLVEKYGRRAYDPAEVSDGFHSWRPFLDLGRFQFPLESLLLEWSAAGAPDTSQPWSKHYFDEYRIADAESAAMEAQG